MQHDYQKITSKIIDKGSREIGTLFSDVFMFELTREEMVLLSKSQNVISIQTTGTKGGRSKPIKDF